MSKAPRGEEAGAGRKTSCIVYRMASLDTMLSLRFVDGNGEARSPSSSTGDDTYKKLLLLLNLFRLPIRSGVGKLLNG